MRHASQVLEARNNGSPCIPPKNVGGGALMTGRLPNATCENEGGKSLIQSWTVAFVDSLQAGSHEILEKEYT